MSKAGDLLKEVFQRLPGVLLPWYRAGHRELPWRQTREPYYVWLSEIMLQQTRVEAVKGYYSRFLEALPTIADLARCPEDQLHKLWEGLGYYSRVRNLQKAARVIQEDFGGVFPGTYEQVLSLPGIGEYTAGAVCSIAFGQRMPAVDGNVLRLASRLLDDHSPIDDPRVKRTVRDALQEIYPEDAGDFTQALMELGATLCGPNREPQCNLCPCREFCLGYVRGTAAELPVKSPPKKKREEDKTVFILRCRKRYGLHKRANKGLLAGLWEFPNVTGCLEASQAAEQIAHCQPSAILRQTDKKHIFTHIIWNMRGFYFEVNCMSPEYQWFTEEEIITSAALPTAFRQFWEERDHV